MRQAILREGGQVAPPGGRQPKISASRGSEGTWTNESKVRRSMRIAERISPEAKVTRGNSGSIIKTPSFRSQSYRQTLSVRQ